MKRAKAFTYWQGKNKFIFSGKVILGPDYPKAFITIAIILISSIAFLSTVCRNFQITISIASALLTIACLYLLIKTATTNPGYINRQEYPFASGPSGSPTIYSALVSDPTKAAAIETQYFEIIKSSSRVKLKYCRTCWIARPPRVSHCPDCDLCVEHFDHHCPWIGICIGKYNYFYYLLFLLSTVTLLIFDLAVCLSDIAMYVKQDASSSVKVLDSIGASIFIGFFILVILFFVAGLFIFHCYLVTIGLTTNEAMKKSFGRMPLQPFYLSSFFKHLKARLHLSQALRFNPLEEIKPGNKDYCSFSHSSRAVARLGLLTELEQKSSNYKLERDDVSETPSILHNI